MLERATRGRVPGLFHRASEPRDVNSWLVWVPAHLALPSRRIQHARSPEQLSQLPADVTSSQPCCGWYAGEMRALQTGLFLGRRPWSVAARHQTSFDYASQSSRQSGHDLCPAWSPDGAKIVFASTRDGGRRRFFVMDADGKNVKQLTSGDSECRCPAWSLDGRKIAFAKHVGLNAQVFVMDADGNNQKTSATTAPSRQIRFGRECKPPATTGGTLRSKSRLERKASTRARRIDAIFDTSAPGATAGQSNLLACRVGAH